MCWGHLCEIGIRSEARSLPAVWAAMKELGSFRNIAWVPGWHVEIWSISTTVLERKGQSEHPQSFCRRLAAL